MPTRRQVDLYHEFETNQDAYVEDMETAEEDIRKINDRIQRLKNSLSLLMEEQNDLAKKLIAIRWIMIQGQLEFQKQFFTIGLEDEGIIDDEDEQEPVKH